MPSRISLFFRRDRTRSGHSDTDTTQRSRVTKRLSLFSLNAGKPSRDPTLARDNASPDNAPRPPRSIRASAANVPELPSYPIYQSFNPSRHLSLLPEGRPRDDAPCSDRRPARIASVADFQALRRRRSRQNLDRYAALSTADKPPAYDRAAELGTIYRSILPDFQAMCEDEEVRDTGNGQHFVDDQQQPSEAEQHTCPRTAAEEGEQATTDNQETPSGAHLSPPPDPTRNAPSVASSTTAVDSDDHAPVPGLQQQPETENSPQPPQTTSTTWPLPTATPSPPPEPTTPPPPPIPQRHRDRRSRITPAGSQHSSVGLQICTELLTAQLRKALSLDHHQHQDERRRQGCSSECDGAEQSGGDDEREPKQKLQVLLLIEAYEGVLRRCRREMMGLALGDGGDADEAGEGGGEGA